MVTKLVEYVNLCQKFISAVVGVVVVGVIVAVGVVLGVVVVSGGGGSDGGSGGGGELMSLTGFKRFCFPSKS